MKPATRITQLNLIQPKKCIIEDFEILAFENEEEFKYYTIWHEALVDKTRATTTNGTSNGQFSQQPSTSSSSTSKTPSKKSAGERLKDGASRLNKPASGSTPLPSQPKTPAPVAIIAPTIINTTTSKASTTKLTSLQTSNQRLSQPENNYQIQNAVYSIPNGLDVINPTIPNTLNAKEVSKYKLTKLWNKYYGRQERRNYVIVKQRCTKIDDYVAKSYLNVWTAYTALQALRLPESKVNQLSAATTNGGKFFTHMPQQAPIQLVNGGNVNANGKKIKTPNKKTKIALLNQQQQSQKPPMHLLYIDPGNIITYSNRINPQQIIEYKKKPPIQPSSATSKKSSAASYDVYEIMEVLANTNKTNVTITRNANRPHQHSNPIPGSIYSHSVNSNTPGIVSTQLHLQAKSYLDLMSKFYAEEAQRLEEERLEMMNQPSVEQMVSKYLKI